MTRIPIRQNMRIRILPSKKQEGLVKILSPDE